MGWLILNLMPKSLILKKDEYKEVLHIVAYTAASRVDCGSDGAQGAESPSEETICKKCGNALERAWHGL